MNTMIKNLIGGLMVHLLMLPALASAQQLTAVIDTDRGVMEVELNHRAAPTTVDVGPVGWGRPSRWTAASPITPQLSMT